MVAVVAVAVAVILVVKVLVRAEEVINMLVEELAINVRVAALAGVEIIVVTDMKIVLEFAVTVSHPVDVVVDVFMADVTIGVRRAIGVELSDTNAAIFAVGMTVLEVTISTS